MTDQIEPGSIDDPLAGFHSLPHTLREWREHIGWTQDQLAAKSGVSQKTISAIETGLSDPQDGTLMKFAEAFGYNLGVSPDSLYKDLAAARDRKPTDTVSPFAKRLDNLLQGHPAPVRIFFEEMIMKYYLDMVKINANASRLQRAERAKKNRGSKP